MYKCPECGFTGEGCHHYSCSRGKPKHSINPDFTTVLDHFDNLKPSSDAPEMLPVIKDDE